MPVLQSLNYKLQRTLSDMLPNTSKVIKKYVLAIEGLDTSYATILYVHNLVETIDQPGKVASLAHSHLNREN